MLNVENPWIKKEKMYKLAIVPKVSKRIEYASAFGSQHDYKHIAKCIKSTTFNIDINCKIIYELKFLSSCDGFV